MKNIKYLLLLFLGFTVMYACDEDDAEVYDIPGGSNIVAFEDLKLSLGAVANGDEYPYEIQIKATGPVLDQLTGDVTVSVAGASNSTAIAGTHYRIDTPEITLLKENNYLGVIKMAVTSEGIVAPIDDTPEFEAWVAPVLYLEVTSATGDASVIPGKAIKLTLNFTAPNPWAGDYDVEMKYFHPSAGEYPDNLSGGVRHYVKTLNALSGRVCETGFAVWGSSDLCTIKVNADNSIKFIVADTWDYSVSLGVPGDPSLVSHFDPVTRKIYLYYSYSGSTGFRIFHEVFTPKF